MSLAIWLTGEGRYCSWARCSMMRWLKRSDMKKG
jgi:hypothetical protein